MRYLPFLVALALSPAAAAAQTKPEEAAPEQQPLWLQSDEAILLRTARIAFPTRPGGLSLSGSSEFSHKGEGIDAAVEYRSADEKVIATAYLFYPGLPHSGLAALATDNAIRNNSTSAVSGGEIRKVAAAGVADAAVRADYSNYRNGHASSAALFKAGRWLVKLRVTGPESRKSEVEGAMAALLSGTKVGKGIAVHPAAPLSVAPCTGNEGGKNARMLPDPPAAEGAAHAFLGTFDGGGLEARERDGSGKTILGSRVPETFCRSDGVRVGDERVPVLRSLGGKATSIDGRTRLVVLLGDGGGMLELVEAPNLKRHLLLHHQVGRTAILGGWDGVPSDAQISALLAGGPNDTLRIRAAVELRPGKGDNIQLMTPPNAPRPTT
jgi:hypothetical protein